MESWTPNEDKLLLELIEEGKLTYHQIGKQINRTSESARSRYRRLRGAKKDNKHGISIQSDDPNNLLISSKGTLVRTLDELLEACETDQNTWAVDRHVINQWQVYSKTGGLVPLYQVKAWLIRKTPTEIFPTIQPITPSTHFTPPKPKTKSSYKTLIIPDIHFGFWRDMDTAELTPIHDRQCLDLILQLLSTVEFDNIIYLGDILDMPDWTDKFLRTPEFTHTTQPAINEAHSWLFILRNASPRSEQKLIEGNHENRATKSIIKNLSAAYNIKAANTIYPAMSIQSLLSLNSLHIEWVGDYPNGEVWINDNLRAEHGRLASSPPGATARSMLDNLSMSTIQGHVHRLESATLTKYIRDGHKTMQAGVAGCLIKLSGKIPANYRNQNWQNGFMVVDHDNTHFNITPILIENNSMFFENHKYEAQSTKEISNYILP